MKVLVLGGLGSIGRRYCAILKYLGVDYVVADSADGSLPFELSSIEFDRAIIATPTDTHYELCKVLIGMEKVFLCEKPLSKSLKECEELSKYPHGYVVNNYYHAMRAHGYGHNEQYPTIYDYFRTGRDGLLWDCCQLIYQNKNVVLKTDSPVWTLETNKGFLKLEDVERSYVTMIREFFSSTCGNGVIYNTTNGYEMTKAVLERMEREGIR